MTVRCVPHYKLEFLPTYILRLQIHMTRNNQRVSLRTIVCRNNRNVSSFRNNSQLHCIRHLLHCNPVCRLVPMLCCHIKFLLLFPHLLKMESGCSDEIKNIDDEPSLEFSIVCLISGYRERSRKYLKSYFGLSPTFGINHIRLVMCLRLRNYYLYS